MSQENNVRVEELFQFIREGRILDAMHEFYDEEVIMEEPAYGKTIGLKANLEREQKFVDSVAEFKGFEVSAVAVGDDVACYENVMDWISQDGQEVHVEQVSVQRWRNGKVVHERFYYSNG